MYLETLLGYSWRREAVGRHLMLCTSPEPAGAISVLSEHMNVVSWVLWLLPRGCLALLAGGTCVPESHSTATIRKSFWLAITPRIPHTKTETYF